MGKKVHQSSLKQTDLASGLAFGQVNFLFLSAQKFTILHRGHCFTIGENVA